jgi:hypothetical protein
MKEKSSLNQLKITRKIKGFLSIPVNFLIEIPYDKLEISKKDKYLELTVDMA